MLALTPAPGTHLVRFVGDRLRFELHLGDAAPGQTVRLRTNLGRGAVARREVIAAAGLASDDDTTFAGASWRDVPMRREGERAWVELPLLEVGHFRAKAYVVDERGAQHWPAGDDVGISVHPSALRSANAVYCAFPRAFGAGRGRDVPSEHAAAVRALDERGFTVIPASGTLRDVTRALPHIMDELGFRVLHLLPIGPVPTTNARYGRFGSPYAQLDLNELDPALVEHDKRSTGRDQLCELCAGVHARGGLVLLDVVLNHTGWGSRLQEAHPEWFRRDADGKFHSPGAWGNTWADLVELDQGFPLLWDELARSLLAWCRLGIDGFRCDAGYMIPLAAWQLVVARVREEFPDTVFLLEGLGGPWQATEARLAEGGMQWAYSELFQNYEPAAVAGYLDHALRQSERVGVLVHYAETHDNDRLAVRGARWASLRTALAALCSTAGAFGVTAGVEWLCTDKVDVHGAAPLRWGGAPNLVPQLARLNRLLSEHPCFFAGAEVTRVSEVDAPVVALARTSAEGADACLVLVNLFPDQGHVARVPLHLWRALGEPAIDLLGGPTPRVVIAGDQVQLELGAGAACCLAADSTPRGLAGDTYRAVHAQNAWALTRLATVLPDTALGPLAPAALAAWVARDPARFLASLTLIDAERAQRDLAGALAEASAQVTYPPVVVWRREDARRVTLVPHRHWLLVEHERPFTLALTDGDSTLRTTSVPFGAGRHGAAFAPGAFGGGLERDVTLSLDGFAQGHAQRGATLRWLGPQGELPALPVALARQRRVLLTNGRGAMARLPVDLGVVRSKYDCLLGANLHPDVPCDRHVLVKRVRAWVNADGFLTALDGARLERVQPGPPACFTFVAGAGDGRRVRLELSLWLQAQRNSVVVRLRRLGPGSSLPADARVSVTLRFDVEDRSYHGETHADAGTERHFEASVTTLAGAPGFRFAPSDDRVLTVSASSGRYHAAPEWSRDLQHVDEAARAQTDRGDGYSPGWFELPLAEGASADVVARAEASPAGEHEPPPVSEARDLDGALARALDEFVVRRGDRSTVIAGYPWFLDWGRDSLIVARGLVAAGRTSVAREVISSFARLEQGGTLPNFLVAEDGQNRETSDAPLWLARAARDLAASAGAAELGLLVGDGRTLERVLVSIAEGYLAGTRVGVAVDHDSGLVWSPPHFTWMDTSHPAGTPREGYPIELQALWLSLLEHLIELGHARFGAVRARALESIERYWHADRGWFADTLHAPRGTPAQAARADDHLRPNQLLLVALGYAPPERARAAVAAAQRWLLVPGALRTLAPLPVTHALPLSDRDGRPLNDPLWPYWPRYEGDEDTRRKPAYHNGTAWPWWLPIWCEALVTAWNRDPLAVAAARSVLGSTASLLGVACLGQVPEILDGDAPHAPRGCDAQAWSVSEALRVQRWLSGLAPAAGAAR